MAAFVDEIMNRELYSVRATESAERVLRHILALGITGAPVLDEQGHPMGMLSFRDLLGEGSGGTAGERMTAPAVVVRTGTRVADAARLLGETGYHRLVVVDANGKAVGLLSALDVVRALVGIPAAHPASFPHFDRGSGITWMDDATLELDHVPLAPDGPGIFLLVHGGAGIPETIVWGESAENVRTRLYDLLATPQNDSPMLAHWLERGSLRFRAAAVPDVRTRRRALERALRGRPPVPRH